MAQPKEYEILYADMSAFDNESFEGFRIDWGAKGIGFGQIDFFYKKEDDKLDEYGVPIPEGRVLYCDNEFMSKEFVRAVLDKLVDNAQFRNGYEKEQGED